MCRIYGEREVSGTEEIYKLYITDIEAGDGGRYTCQRMEKGVMTEEKAISLLITG